MTKRQLDKIPIQMLEKQLDGELFLDALHQKIYATDASIYRQLPLGVCYPKHALDIQRIVQFANAYKLPLIPRAAGTSLAGQCVGPGLVVDVSKHMNKILEINPTEKYVRVQPGVVRDELNFQLKPFGLHFGPNTSTANRATIGGMVGNNSCGSSSIAFGTTRDHILGLGIVLSDGSIENVTPIAFTDAQSKTNESSLLGGIYNHILALRPQMDEIRGEYPNPAIRRRNTGYALDLVIEEDGVNLCNLLAGSEGTLAFTTEIKIAVQDLPPPFQVVVCPHFESVERSLIATQHAMGYKPHACELMDKTILDCTNGLPKFENLRFFVEEDPMAILMIELRASTKEELHAKAQGLQRWMLNDGGAYVCPIVPSENAHKVWALRRAGLGLLANVPGSRKAVACIEDTAVSLNDLPAFVRDFSNLMIEYQQESVYYAHVGDGELHLRPLLDLRDSKDRHDLVAITEDVAKLVKQYGGSMSGEHGDGRVRGPVIPMVIGADNYERCVALKAVCDPNHIFNPGKIVHTAPIDQDLRIDDTNWSNTIDTAFTYERAGGFLATIEQCNGSGDCRKLPFSGGVMCPSYHATRAEKDTTRARANALREFINSPQHQLEFAHPALDKVMDLCISCKGCTSECPSNVDMATLKAEYLHQKYKLRKIPLRSKLFANNARYIKLARNFGALGRLPFHNKWMSGIMKNFMQVARERTLPTPSKISVREWYRRNYVPPKNPIQKLYFFCDEFTDLLDADIGIKAVDLLRHLGFDVLLVEHPESGRSAISKGLLNVAKKYAEKNVQIFTEIISSETPLIGLEPSAILSFKDEYPRLVSKELRKSADQIAQHVYLIDSFLRHHMEAGVISKEVFTTKEASIILHPHCHQKALSDASDSAMILGFLPNRNVEMIQSSCCGMAGSFGYEKEHYKISMQMGEISLFPAIRKSEKSIVAATGTSCRHQICDGTKRRALHPVEILYEALTAHII